MSIDPYRSEPLTDFTQEANRRQMEEALAYVKAHLGQTYSLLIGGVHQATPEEIVSINPGNPEQVVGRVAKATKEHIDEALKVGWEAFREWKRVPGPARARYLFKAAAIMRRRKFELSAWEVYEAGKTWAEADGDVAEAIDFLEYYGRQMQRLSGPVPTTPLPGEEDVAFYVPLGVGAVIPPWNFPLAILTGMSSSAMVAGNPILLKPASPTPVIAAKFVEIMEEAGIPAGVLNFVPGDGGVIGDHLVTHPLTRFVSFTGSKEVGLRINRLAAEHQNGQRWIKRVVAEMGGKDAVIVDETADLEAAALGIVQSAFGFQGQKCSACSRAIVVDSVYDQVLNRVLELTRELNVGPAEDYQNQMGPVIDERAFKKIQTYIDWGREHAKLVAGGGAPRDKGYYLEPTIFSEVAPGSKLEQEEIFGPVLSFVRARDFDQALEIANDTEFGLTGSVYSKRRDRIERAAEEFEVGNLYINRKCTGAVVGSHPFGGFNMSGTDSKTGSPDYLLLFMQMKAVAEKF
ncbi:L-glutamate gamma-semialdehyde dehydrogenase [Sulfobacillus harzensis]|uniref:L-glutamate gamma-semialdehyde dehydrogenase n=1 Tax=Sulfobacillus harzensis TaxID=2729629 RepID=A0A7Y0L5H6_9FIRM|nr:L-glutamate gamma-semialdehyde dehydrogenase [Sulfobacillus harzensis]NMP23616.1 L-glutamate gamma-semialdehyde dehydrogenase [Sulfobacillus harzensis]